MKEKLRRLQAIAQRNAGRLSAIAFVTVTGVAHAALDPAVGTGITAAQDDLVDLYGLLTVAGLAVFVAAVVYRKFKLR